MSKRRPLILDHACNTITHGFSWIDRNWSLNGKSITTLGSKIHVVVCPHCGRVNGLSARKCASCGQPLPKRTRTASEQKALELVRYSAKEKKKRRKLIEAFARKRGFSKDWIEQVYQLWQI
jgi:ribosomal protein L37E